MGDVSPHQEDAGNILPMGDMPTEGVASETEVGWELVLPAISDRDGGGWIGGGGYIFFLPPENSLHHPCH